MTSAHDPITLSLRTTEFDFARMKFTDIDISVVVDFSIYSKFKLSVGYAIKKVMKSTVDGNFKDKRGNKTTFSYNKSRFTVLSRMGGIRGTRFIEIVYSNSNYLMDRQYCMLRSAVLEQFEGRILEHVVSGIYRDGNSIVFPLTKKMLLGLTDS